MAKDSEKPEDHDQPEAGPPAVMAEAQALIDDVLDGVTTTASRERLEQLVVQYPSIANLYVESIDIESSLAEMLRQPGSQRSDPSLDDLGSMNEAMIMPAIRGDAERGIADESPAITPPTYPAKYPAFSAGRVPPLWRSRAKYAAILLAAAGIAWFAWPVHSPAIATATAAALFDGPDTLKAGEPLTPGRTIHLREGAVELTFRSGAVAIVKAPAIFRVDGPNQLTLDSGSICAHVPPPAQGFGIIAPGLSVVDRGTNFGVRTSGTGNASEVDVFTGKVDVTALDAAGKSLSSPIALTEGHAARHDAGAAETSPVDVAFSTTSFVREIADVRLPIKLHNTGAESTPDSLDPNWQIVAVPKDPSWKPRPAGVVLTLPAVYQGKGLPGRWISLTPIQTDAPLGDFVFRSTVDLTGFDPATTAINITVAPDNQIADVRLNGISTGVSVLGKGYGIVEHTLMLPGTLPWVAGLNQVDVVVRNVSNPPGPREPNFVGMAWSWTGTAAPVVQRH